MRRPLALFVDRPEYSLLQWRRRRPSFPLVSFSHMVLVLSVIPRPCSKASLLPCLGLCPPLVGWYQIHCERLPRCEWHRLCDHDSHTHHYPFRRRLWHLWSLALVHRDAHLLYACMVCAGSMRVSLRTQRCRLVLDHWKLATGFYRIHLLRGTLGFLRCFIPRLAKNTSFSQSTCKV